MDLRDFSRMPFKLAQQPSRSGKGPHPPPKGDWLSGAANDGGAIALATIASVVLTTVFAVGFVTPLVHTLAIFPFVYAAQRRGDPVWAATIVARWMIALFLGTMVAGVFAPDRVIASVPFGEGSVASFQAWIADGGPVPIRWTHLLWGIAGFFALSLASGGVLGIALTSVALTTTAVGALFLFRHGFNVLQISLVAVPAWQWCLLAAVPFLLVPTSAIFFQRVLGVERDADSLVVSRIQLYVGAGLLATSLLLRVALAGPWRDLLDRWTSL